MIRHNYLQITGKLLQKHKEPELNAIYERQYFSPNTDRSKVFKGKCNKYVNINYSFVKSSLSFLLSTCYGYKSTPIRYHRDFTSYTKVKDY